MQILVSKLDTFNALRVVLSGQENQGERDTEGNEVKNSFDSFHDATS